VCSKLADSAALQGLSSALDDLAANGVSGRGAAGLRQAAADLRAAGDIADATVKAGLGETADALDAVATNGLADRSAVTRLSDSLSVLGEEVQDVCHFPVG
jgi:hypothetical protein